MGRWALISSSLYADPRVGTALDAARGILRSTFGHSDFRGLQAEVITEALAGRSALAVLPTGGGKTLCYQTPSWCARAWLRDLPLIALMENQVAGCTRGVRAALLNSTPNRRATPLLAGHRRASWTWSMSPPKG